MKSMIAQNLNQNLEIQNKKIFYMKEKYLIEIQFQQEKK